MDDFKKTHKITPEFMKTRVPFAMGGEPDYVVNFKKAIVNNSQARAEEIIKSVPDSDPFKKPMKNILAYAKKAPQSRPSHQIELEKFFMKGNLSPDDIAKAQAIIDSMDAKDQYKKPMQSLLDREKSKGATIVPNNSMSGMSSIIGSNPLANSLTQRGMPLTPLLQNSATSPNFQPSLEAPPFPPLPDKSPMTQMPTPQPMPQSSPLAPTQGAPAPQPSKPMPANHTEHLRAEIIKALTGQLDAFNKSQVPVNFAAR